MIQNDIILNLLNDGKYFNKFIYKLDTESFMDAYQVIFKKIIAYNAKYDKRPSSSEIQTDIIEDIKVTDEYAKLSDKILRQKYKAENYSEEWLADNTKVFVKNHRIQEALSACIEMQSKGIINGSVYTEIMEQALSIDFDEAFGYDYLETIDERFESYKIEHARFTLPLDLLNEITGGGVKRKTLNCILSGTGVGKSLFLCNFARHSYERNLNCLYVTMEMPPEDIAQRIDAAYSNTEQRFLKDMSLQNRAKMKMKLEVSHKENFLRIHEFPTGTACANDIKNLILNIESETSKKIDIIFVDYLGIMRPNNPNSRDGLYEKGKAVAEELRALAQIFDIPVWTAQQLNRTGAQSSAITTSDVAESYALSQTCDLMIAIVEDEELKAQNIIRCQQVKNRYNSTVNHSSFLINVDKSIAKILPTPEGAPTVSRKKPIDKITKKINDSKRNLVL